MGAISKVGEEVTSIRRSGWGQGSGRALFGADSQIPGGRTRAKSREMKYRGRSRKLVARVVLRDGGDAGGVRGWYSGGPALSNVTSCRERSDNLGCESCLFPTHTGLSPSVLGLTSRPTGPPNPPSYINDSVYLVIRAINSDVPSARCTVCGVHSADRKWSQMGIGTKDS